MGSISQSPEKAIGTLVLHITDDLEDDRIVRPCADGSYIVNASPIRYSPDIVNKAVAELVHRLSGLTTDLPRYSAEWDKKCGNI